MAPALIPVSPDGHELAAALADLLAGPAERVLLGLAGAPGSGKSTLASALAGHLAREPGTTVVPMDGFHLADVELARRGLLDRKGAPETFDGWGYAALLARLRGRPDHVVMAPGFERDLEQPLAGAVAVPPSTRLVVTEGSYLLLDEPSWRAVRSALDAVWHVVTDEAVRVPRLVARHVASGKTQARAQAWVAEVDEPNARAVEGARHRADLVLDLTRWTRVGPAGQD